MHKKKEIRDCLEKLCRAVPNNPTYSNWLAWDFIQDPKSTLDEKTEALGLVRRALEKDEANGNYLNTYGVVLLRLGYLDEAISALEDARNQRRNEDSSADNYFLAIAFAKKGRKLEAVKNWCLGIGSHIRHQSTHVDSWTALYESTDFLLRRLTRADRTD
jgi:tetratricopeptide (TPR) repeat protein